MPDQNRARYEPRVRRLGRWPFRTSSWQVWDTLLGEWAPNALCGGSLAAADSAAEGLNRWHREKEADRG